MLPPDVLRRLHAFAGDVDRAAPGALAGLYGVGSLALGDFRPPLSNVDALVVSDTAWGPAGLGAVRGATGALRIGHQAPRVACLTWADLTGDPARAAAACFRGRRAVPPGELANSLTWQVLRTAGVCIRGPEYPEIGAGDLRAWAAERLSGWWGGWLAHNRNRPGALWFRRGTAEVVLEVARLSQAVASGRVVSKLEAGDLAVVSSPSKYQRILKDSVGFRRGDRMSMYWGPFERKRAVLAFVEWSLSPE